MTKILQPFKGTVPYEQIENSVQRAIEFLSELGVVYERSRVQKYHENLKALLQSKEEIINLENSEERYKYVAALFETSELIKISNGLSDLEDPKLIEKIKVYLRGPYHLKNETDKSNFARNIGFELFVAAHFKKAGFEIDISTESDIIVKDELKTLFVECKRPLSKKKTGRNLFKAYRQLETRMKAYDYDNSYGLIFISVEKIYNQENLIVPVESEQELQKVLLYNAERVFREEKATIRKFFNIKILGIISFLSILATIEGLNGLIECNQFGAFPLGLKGTANDVYFRQLCKALHNSVPDLKMG